MGMILADPSTNCKSIELEPHSCRGQHSTNPDRHSIPDPQHSNPWHSTRHEHRPTTSNTRHSTTDSRRHAANVTRCRRGVSFLRVLRGYGSRTSRARGKSTPNRRRTSRVRGKRHHRARGVCRSTPGIGYILLLLSICGFVTTLGGGLWSLWVVAGSTLGGGFGVVIDIHTLCVCLLGWAKDC